MIQPMISPLRLKPADLPQQSSLPRLADGIRPADFAQFVIQPRDLVAHSLAPFSFFALEKAARKARTALLSVRLIFLLRS